MSTTVNAATNSPSRRVLQFASDYAGPTALFAFGIALWYYRENENIFSFGAWGVLDFLTGMCMFQAKERKAAVLPLLYGVICAFVVMMIWNNGKWDWTIVESICLVGVAFGLALWRWWGSTAGVVAFCTALAIASIPILLDNYHNPNTWEWWLWIGSGTSATVGLILNRPWKLENISAWLFVAVSEVVTATMLVLLLWPR